MAACACLTLLLPLYMAVRWAIAPPVDEALVAQWQRQVVEQQTEVRLLQERAGAEAQAVGRQLAGMQARLLRMEALGARVTQVAALEDGEFTFENPVATGGPESVEPRVGGFELQRTLADLSHDLKRREAELEVLEALLRDRDYRHATEVAGRPVSRGWVSSPFGSRVDPFSGQSAWHPGVDFSGRRGTDVMAVAGGVVIYADRRPDYGWTVEINHGDGYVTRYAHHQELKVATGEIVKRGQVIGTIGSSGRATGPHLHFEVLKNGRHVDPRTYIARSI
jgi:murein DD-endopeptidase MepM/ murein hydrolase activator NlpD